MNICVRRQKYFSRVSGSLLGINILMIGEEHMDSGIIPQNSVAVVAASVFWFDLCVEKQSKAKQLLSPLLSVFMFIVTAVPFLTPLRKPMS